MSFTVPVGNFKPAVVSVVRPTSVVDTPGTGTIVNSSYAYDDFPGSYGLWTGVSPSNTFSTFTFTSSAVSAGQSLYIVWSGDYTYGLLNISMSTDNGATYAYNYNRYSSTSGKFTDSLAIPDGVTLSNIKLKVMASQKAHTVIGSPVNLYAYDIYIQ